MQSSTGSVPIPSSPEQADTLPLRSASSTLLYDVADVVRSAAALHHSSTSMLCLETGTGVANDMEQSVRQELLTHPWSQATKHSPSAPPLLRQSAASPLVMAGLKPERAEDEQRPVNHQTMEQHSGSVWSRPLITLDDLEDVPSSVLWQPSPEWCEVPRVRSCGAWEGTDC